MIMCPKLLSLFILFWTAILEVNCQFQNFPGLNGACTSCQQNGPTGGNYYVSYPWYPQYSQLPYQNPTYAQAYQQYPQYLPYVSTSNQPQSIGYQQVYTPSTQPSSVSSVNAAIVTKDKANYDNVKTEVIDIEPKYFRYLYSNLFSKSASLPRTRKIGVRKNSPYVVKVDSHQLNSTNVPQVIKKHDVQHKTFTFKKTFVLSPGNQDSVINMNFVNGVIVTTEAPEELRGEGELQENTNERLHQETTTTEQPITTTEEPITTTENDNPANLNSWFK